MRDRSGFTLVEMIIVIAVILILVALMIGLIQVVTDKAYYTKTEAVDLALRHLAGQPMTRDEALAMHGAHAIDKIPQDVAPTGIA